MVNSAEPLALALIHFWWQLDPPHTSHSWWMCCLSCEVFCSSPFGNFAPFCEGVRFQFVWLHRKQTSNFLEWTKARPHSLDSPPAHLLFQVSSVVPHLIVRFWHVITSKQAQSNQDNWHQTSKYKGRRELVISFFALVQVRNVMLHTR